MTACSAWDRALALDAWVSVTLISSWLREFWALVTLPCAVTRFCVELVGGELGLRRLQVGLAWETSAWRVEGLRVAKTVPAFTTWPTAALTEVTVPATAKLTFAWVAGSTVPVVAIVSLTSPVVTAIVL